MERNKINGLKIFMIRLLEININKYNINLSTFIPLDTFCSLCVCLCVDGRKTQPSAKHLTIVLALEVHRESSETNNNKDEKQQQLNGPNVAISR